MSTSEKELMQYLVDNFEQDEQRFILEHVYSMCEYLMQQGAEGVVIANLVATKLNQHAEEKEPEIAITAKIVH